MTCNLAQMIAICNFCYDTNNKSNNQSDFTLVKINYFRCARYYRFDYYQWGSDSVPVRDNRLCNEHKSLTFIISKYFAHFEVRSVHIICLMTIFYYSSYYLSSEYLFICKSKNNPILKKNKKGAFCRLQNLNIKKNVFMYIIILEYLKKNCGCY